jgi:hypothetical protein
MNIQRAANRILTYAGGSAIAVAADILALKKIENVWARNGIRVVAAAFAPMFLKGDMGSAFSGAILYPVVEEMAAELNILDNEADLECLAADLEAALDDVDEYGYENPTPAAIW